MGLVPGLLLLPLQLGADDLVRGVGVDDLHDAVREPAQVVRPELAGVLQERGLGVVVLLVHEPVG